MNDCVLSSSAQRDLAEIWHYIAIDSEDRADKVIIGIRQAKRLLVEQPGIGHQHRDLPDFLRVWSSGPYLIIYRSKSRPLEIVRIIHGARDIPNLFDADDE